MSAPIPSPYYLLNFERALAWVAERYDDLLDAYVRSAWPGARVQTRWLRYGIEHGLPVRALDVRWAQAAGIDSAKAAS